MNYRYYLLAVIFCLQTTIFAVQVKITKKGYLLATVSSGVVSMYYAYSALNIMRGSNILFHESRMHPQLLGRKMLEDRAMNRFRRGTLAGLKSSCGVCIAFYAWRHYKDLSE